MATDEAFPSSRLSLSGLSSSASESASKLWSFPHTALSKDNLLTVYDIFYGADRSCSAKLGTTVLLLTILTMILRGMNSPLLQDRSRKRLMPMGRRHRSAPNGHSDVPAGTVTSSEDEYYENEDSEDKRGNNLGRRRVQREEPSNDGSSTLISIHPQPLRMSQRCQVPMLTTPQKLLVRIQDCFESTPRTSLIPRQLQRTRPSERSIVRIHTCQNCRRHLLRFRCSCLYTDWAAHWRSFNTSSRACVISDLALELTSLAADCRLLHPSPGMHIQLRHWLNCLLRPLKDTVIERPVRG